MGTVQSNLSAGLDCALLEVQSLNPKNSLVALDAHRTDTPKNSLDEEDPHRTDTLKNSLDEEDAFSFYTPKNSSVAQDAHRTDALKNSLDEEDPHRTDTPNSSLDALSFDNPNSLLSGTRVVAPVANAHGSGS